MLAWLIAAQQVVVLYYNDIAWLFFRGKVYQPSSRAFRNLPQYRKGYYPIWTLIDMDSKTPPPLEMNGSNVWPIQATPPNPDRWEVWAKYLNPRQLGMPLWTEAELIEGYVLICSPFRHRRRPGSRPKTLCLRSLRLIPRYAELQAGLQAVFDGSEPPDETIEAMMEIFEVESKKAETGMEKKDGRPPAAQDADKPDTYQKKAAGEKWVNKVFEVLVRNAIEEFGHIPRDVYRAITNLSEEKEKRDWEVEELTYSELRGLVKGFSKDHALDEFSHRVVVVYPRGTSSIYALDHWGMDFKSPRIWTAVKNKMQLVEDEHLRETVGLLRRFSEGSTLAGRIFEVAANNVLSRGESAPEPIAMNSQGNPPLFSGRTDLPSSSPRPSFTTARVITMVDFSKALTGVTLDGDRYYVPICSNHPLFDAFTVDLVGDKTALISVLQTTISQTHGGSANGYFNIRKIMMRVRELLTQSNMKGIELKVAYVLVCPEDELQHTWQMPGSWDKEISQNDHRGKPFCVRIPGPSRYLFRILRPG